MAFIDRVVEFPGRVQLTNVSGDVYDMVRAEGDEYTEGTLLNAANLNQQTQLDSIVQAKFAMLETDTSYQNDMSNALNYLARVNMTYGYLTGYSTTVSLTTSAQKLPLNTTFIGSGCSKSSNGIKVDEAGVYVISGSAYFSTGFTSLDLVHVLVYVNNTPKVEAVMRIGTANYYVTVTPPPIIVSLSANDVVYLYAYNQGGNRGICEGRLGNGITVFRIA